mgnify:CR=1 FL=1
MVSPELIELLHYMEKSTNEVAGSCTSQKIKLLHQKDLSDQVEQENGGEIHARMGRKRNRNGKKPLLRVRKLESRREKQLESLKGKMTF